MDDAEGGGDGGDAAADDADAKAAGDQDSPTDGSLDSPNRGAERVAIAAPQGGGAAAWSALRRRRGVDAPPQEGWGGGAWLRLACQPGVLARPPKHLAASHSRPPAGARPAGQLPADGRRAELRHLIATLKEAIAFCRRLEGAMPAMRGLLASPHGDVVTDAISLLTFSRCGRRPGAPFGARAGGPRAALGPPLWERAAPRARRAALACGRFKHRGARGAAAGALGPPACRRHARPPPLPPASPHRPRPAGSSACPAPPPRCAACGRWSLRARRACGARWRTPGSRSTSASPTQGVRRALLGAPRSAAVGFRGRGGGVASRPCLLRRLDQAIPCCTPGGPSAAPCRYLFVGRPSSCPAPRLWP
jgi:hypothetical protein